MERKGIIRVLMGNYYGLYKYIYLHYIICVSRHMYAIPLMINTEILILLVRSINDSAFNHAYIYIVIFIGFSQY